MEPPSTSPQNTPRATKRPTKKFHVEPFSSNFREVNNKFVKITRISQP